MPQRAIVAQGTILCVSINQGESRDREREWLTNISSNVYHSAPMHEKGENVPHIVLSLLTKNSFTLIPQCNTPSSWVLPSQTLLEGIWAPVEGTQSLMEKAQVPVEWA